MKMTRICFYAEQLSSGRWYIGWARWYQGILIGGFDDLGAFATQENALSAIARRHITVA